jgi:hypothetical protein
MDFIVLSCLIWSLTTLICYSKTTEWLRAEMGVYQVDDQGQPLTGMGRVLSCFWCTAWILSLVLCWFWIGSWGWRTPLVGLAASGLAILVNHWSRMERDHGNL